MIFVTKNHQNKVVLETTPDKEQARRQGVKGWEGVDCLAIKFRVSVKVNLIPRWHWEDPYTRCNILSGS
jgi:hypothetical protein